MNDIRTALTTGAINSLVTLAICAAAIAAVAVTSSIVSF